MQFEINLNDAVEEIIMGKKEIVQSLKQFGLTEYESKVYSSLIFIGPSKAGEVARESTVPQSKIYEVLESLMSKQLIEMFGGRPKEFRAIEPKNALTGLIERRESELGRLKSSVEDLTDLLKPMLTTEDVIEGIWTQKSEKKNEVLNRLTDMLSRSKKYAYDITRDFSYSGKMRETLKQCKRRGVKIRTIVLGGINESNYFKAKWFQANGFQIKSFETSVHPRILVVDGREVSIRLDNNPVRNRFTFHSIWFEDPSLVKVFDNYMKNLWEISKPVNLNSVPVAVPAR